MRRAAKTDRNQAEIVSALRSIGATVQPLHTVGQGVPDLLGGFRGQRLLMEVKDGKKPPSAQELTQDQREWISAWRGGCVWVIRDVSQAIEAAQQTTA